MTYDELFQLKGFEKAKLLAGHSILTREITGAHVVEMIEAQDWVKRGELVFVSGVAFQDIYEDLKRAINNLAGRQVAGIVLEVGPFIPAVTGEIIDLANQLNLPLLSLPYEIPVSFIISQIYFDIYSKEETNKSVEKFMAEVLYDDTEKALERIELFKFDQNKKHVALYIGPDMPQQRKADEETMQKLLRAVRMSFTRQDQLLYLLEDDGVVVLQELDDHEKPHQLMETKRQEIQQNLQMGLEKTTVSMGVGNAFGGAGFIKESVSEARKAYKILRSCQGKNTLRFYDEIGIYRIFFDLKSTEVLENLYQEILGELLQYDRKNDGELVRTLEVYLQEDCNTTLTAERLFVHRNTVKYRIKRIDEILGQDLHDVTVQFNLRLAYRIKRYLGW